MIPQIHTELNTHHTLPLTPFDDVLEPVVDTPILDLILEPSQILDRVLGGETQEEIEALHEWALGENEEFDRLIVESCNKSIRCCVGRTFRVRHGMTR